LRSAAFSDADRHQTIDFVSKSIQRIDDHTVRVSGDLTLLGLRKPLSLDVAVTRGGARQRLDFRAQTRIDRLAFGMKSGLSADLAGGGTGDFERGRPRLDDIGRGPASARIQSLAATGSSLTSRSGATEVAPVIFG
jgi:hypothetical protein